jgi:transmembrane sensor
MTQQPGAGASKAEKEAVEWHMQLGRMPCSLETIHAFFAWRADPENLSAYERVELVWDAVRKLAEEPVLEQLLGEAVCREAEEQRHRQAAPGSGPVGPH